MLNIAKLKNVSQKAFTLIELMVSMAVIGVLSTILLANYPDTATRIKLQTVQDTLSLALREAQIRGSAVDSYIASAGNISVSGYGLHFDKSVNNSYVVFEDKVDILSRSPTRNNFGLPLGNGVFDIARGRSPSEENSKNILPAGFYISDMCVNNGAAQVCSSDSLVSTLDISFTRPKTEGFITINGITTPYKEACIELKSPDGAGSGVKALSHTKKVVVSSIGRFNTFSGTCK